MRQIEFGSHCFGNILRVDGKDYRDMSFEEKKKIIDTILYDRGQLNHGHLLQEVFQKCLSKRS